MSRNTREAAERNQHQKKWEEENSFRKNSIFAKR